MTPEELIQTWYAATTNDSSDEDIMLVLLRLAHRHPQWFDPALVSDPSQMLFEAIAEAQDDMVSRKLIEAAYWIVKANEDRLADPQPEPEPEPEPEPLPVADDPLKLLYRRLRDNVTQGVAGDVMQMPPSWGELLTAVHEAAFPDGDGEPEPLTVPEPVADVLRGIAEQMAAGARVVFMETDRGYAAGAKAQREADHSLLMSQGESFPAGMLHNRPLVTDTDDDTTTDPSGIEVAKSIAYAEGWDAGYSEGHAEGYRDAVERFAGGGEA